MWKPRPQPAKKAWHVILYVVEYDRGLESDVQDCFIHTMKLDKPKNRLIFTNEAGHKYVLDLKTRKSHHVVSRKRK